MIWIYRLFFLPFFLLSLPFYLRLMLRRGGYGEDLASRFGSVPTAEKTPGSFRIWIQAVSVGEVLAVAPLIRALNRSHRIDWFLTTTTSTGRRLAFQQDFGGTVRIRYFPIDWWPFSRRAWQRVQPDLVLLTESELWPEHLHQARIRKIPVVLVNGRLSDRSFRRYHRFRGMVRGLMFDPIHQILASSAADARRFQHLHSSARVEACGNLKLDQGDAPRLRDSEKEDLRKQAFGEHQDGVVVIGASTWPGEERMLLDLLPAALEKGTPLRLIIVPRHVERRREIIEELEGSGLPFGVRSQEKTAPPEKSPSRSIYLADTTGELSRLIQIADLAFIGKSLPPHTEGQTPIEAAMHGIPMVYGPGMGNFRTICRDLEEHGAAIRAGDREDAIRQLALLARNRERREVLKKNALNWHQANQGSVKRTIEVLNQYLTVHP